MAIFSLSPSVSITEEDFTFSIPAVSTSAGGFAGTFQWGPVLEFRTVGSPTDLKNTFYQPNDDTAISYFTAENYLQYSTNLTVVRVVGIDALNATANGTGHLIKNLDDYTHNIDSGLSNIGLWAAKYPGALGNGLRVSICDNKNFSRTLTGKIDASVTSPNISGTGTQFTTELVIGSILRDSTGAYIGQVQSITSDTALILTGNSGLTIVSTASNSPIADWEFKHLFGVAPSTSAYAANLGGANDEVHVVIQDTTGFFSSQGAILKTYPFLSVASDAKAADGTISYYKTVINNDSNYVWWAEHPTDGNNWGSPAKGISFAALGKVHTDVLGGGVSDDVLTDAAASAGFLMFADSEIIDINLIPIGGASPTVANLVLSDVADVRKDCVVFISPKLSDVFQNSGHEVDSTIATRNLLPSIDRGFMDSNWKYQFDRYNGVYRWLPLNGDTAGLAARTDATNAPWFSPAGYNRGQYKNVVKLAYLQKKADRDRLFQVNINPVVTQKGEGTVLLGDKTLLARPSAFDAIGVRRLFDTVEKAIATAAKYRLFEFNDAATRASFLASVNPFLRTVQGGRGIVAFKVICDTSNNTPDVINRKSFVGQIFIQPNESIRNVELAFIATPAGVSFQEITGGQ